MIDDMFMVIVIGVVLLAIGVDVGAAIDWLRRWGRR
jgi:hypothetical protein